MSRLLSKDVVGGLVLMAVGAYFLVSSFDYRMGTPRSMGPGYFPMLLGGAMVAVSAVVVYAGLRDPVPVERPGWRTAGAALGGVLAFGAGMAHLGLGPAVFLTILVSALGDPASRPLGTLVLASAVTLLCWAVFPTALGLPMTMLKSPF